jgi:hypothetical protein
MRSIVTSSRLATLGTLVGAGAIGVPVCTFVLSLFLLLPTDATILAKVIAPFFGAIAVFLFGFWYYIPISLLIGGGAHLFLHKVGFRTLRPYLFAGPVVGLCAGMLTHFFAPGVVAELLIGGWPTFTYLAAWCLGGTVLTGIFWTIRRPDRPWDDLADRRLAGEDV